MSTSYLNPEVPTVVFGTIAKLINDPKRNHPVWNLVRGCPDTYHDLREILQKFNVAGFSLDEFTVLQTLMSENHDDRVVISRLAYDTLPRLRETETRFRTLETTLDLISRSFFAFVKDFSEALPEEQDPMYLAEDSPQRRLDSLSAVLQKHKDTRCYDNKSGTLQPISKIANILGYLDMEDRCKVLTERVQALEEMVKENRHQMKPPQTVTAPEESSVAGTQELERAMQAHQLTFAAVSDASESSTYAPTPASVSGTAQIVILSQLTISQTVVNESLQEPDSIEPVVEVAATPLKLHVRVYRDAMARHTHRRGPAQSVLVRIHPDTPFKTLTDKLREKHGDRTMALDESPSIYIFGSDTPASVSVSPPGVAKSMTNGRRDQLELNNNAKLIYATYLDGFETLEPTTN
jgi:hypothetical protein